MRKIIYRAEVWFSGRVQGVGFRWTTLQVAREFDVSGTVKNLQDGRVHLVAEGEENEVTGFVDELRKQMEAYIRETEVRNETAEPRLKGFRIL